MTVRVFTLNELNYYNGKNGRRAYVAYKGDVYDVTGSFHWKNGSHWVIHEAGLDLTEEMNNAPHFEDLLLKFKVVGKLVQERI